MNSHFTNTKAIVKANYTGEGHVIYSSYHNLSENSLLFLSKDNELKSTQLKIYNLENLKDPILETSIADDCEFIGVFPDGSFLLTKGRHVTNELLKVSGKNLSIISSMEWKSAWFNIIILDNNHFLSLTRSRTPNKNKAFFCLYQWENNNYKKDTMIEFYDEEYGRLMNFHSLGDNRYCCQLRGNNDDLFSILLFEINQKNAEIKKLGFLDAKFSSRSDKYFVFPNGHIVTYHEHRDHIQIWDPKTFQCIKEWNWSDIESPHHFHAYDITLLPFPDSKNILVKKGDELYVFDTDRLKLKKIDLKHDIHHFGNHFILPNGQVLAFIDDKKNKDHTLNILQFDLPEMIQYRKAIYDTQKTAAWFLRKNKCPKPIIQYIFSYAFTPESKALLAQKIVEDNHEAGNKKCLMM